MKARGAVAAAAGAALVAACSSPQPNRGAWPAQTRTAPVEIRRVGLAYPDVASARQALAARSDVSTRIEDGWTVIEVPSEQATWRFVPQNYLSYPALMMRRIVVRDGRVRVEYAVLCQGAAAACQDFEQGVEKQNESIRVQLESPSGG
ncbi:MAG: hypothetical protein IRZ06_05045 [Nevskia sp.]|nr:hypothetical protein [Nevskia sp.]